MEKWDLYCFILLYTMCSTRHLYLQDFLGMFIEIILYYINKIITIYNIGFSSHNHASTRSIRKRDEYV